MTSSEGLHLHGALLRVAITYGIVAQGAFFGRQLAILQVIIVASLATALTSMPPRISDFSRPESIASGAAIGTTLLSASQAGALGQGVPQALFICTLLAVVLIVRRIGHKGREALLAAVVAVGAVIGVLGWLAVAFHAPPGALINGALWRASTTISYANAAACLLMMCSFVALIRVIDGGRLAAVAAFASLVGLGATFSRGAALAWIVGATFMAILVGWRRWAAAVWHVLAAATIGVVGLVPSVAASGRAHPGVAIAAFLCASCLLLVKPRFGAKRTAIALAMGTVVLVSVFVVAPPSALTKGIIQVREARVSRDISVRDRENRWSQFLDIARAHPVLGAGPGGFLLRYPDPGRLDVGRFAHNEYLQILAEQGVVGLAAVLLGLLLLARELLRVRTANWMWVGPAAALSGLLVQAGTDFVWNVPLIPIVGATLWAVTQPFVGVRDE